MYISVCICMYVCKHVCIYVRMYVCMYVCLSVTVNLGHIDCTIATDTRQREANVSVSIAKHAAMHYICEDKEALF